MKTRVFAAAAVLSWLAAFGAGGLLGVRPACAAMIIDYGTNEPAEGVIISQTNQGVAIDWTWTPTERFELAQSFEHTSNFVLDRIVVRVDQASNAEGQDFDLIVVDVDVGDTPVQILNETAAWPYNGAEDLYVTFDVPNVLCQGYRHYAFALVWHNPTAGKAVGIFQMDGDHYPDGSLVASTDGWETVTDNVLGSTGRDMRFYIQTPEPATLALMAAGLVTALIRRRR